MRFLRLLGIAILAAVALPSASAVIRGDGVAEGLIVALDLERKARQADVDDLESLTAQVDRASERAALRRSRLLELVKEAAVDGVDIVGAEDEIAEAEARVRTLEERRRLVIGRLLDRVRRMSLLAEEVSRRRTARKSEIDPVSGRWDVSIDPGRLTGTFRLRLDGTIVSGDYTISGGFRGSLRGTFVGDRLTLQRIDSERGFDATFYGRLLPQQRKISGSWEATVIAPATGPTVGTWGAALAPEPDEIPGETRERND